MFYLWTEAASWAYDFYWLSHPHIVTIIRLLFTSSTDLFSLFVWLVSFQQSSCNKATFEINFLLLESLFSLALFVQILFFSFKYTYIRLSLRKRELWWSNAVLDMQEICRRSRSSKPINNLIISMLVYKESPLLLITISSSCLYCRTRILWWRVHHSLQT